MKILFFYRGAESFGIEQISACLKEAGHATELIFDPGLDDTFYFKSRLFNFLNVKDKLLCQAKRFSPDLLAFSSTTNMYPYVLDMARLLKKELNVSTIIGGIHATVLAEEVIKEDCFDMLCVGEGEQAMLELAQKLQDNSDHSSIQNLFVKKNGRIMRNAERPLIKDLDSLPFPDKDIFYKRGVFYKSIQVMASRGCPFDCSFCVNSFYRKRYGNMPVRRRKVESLIKELKSYKEKYRPEFVDFQDDCFPVSLDWLEEFSLKYKKEVGLGFLANIHPSLAGKNTARLLREAGCRGVCMGVQSGNEAVRRSILKRNDTNEQVVRAARIFKDEGIRVTTEFIFSLPGETAALAWESVELNRQIAPYSSSTFLFYPFPGTELAEYSYSKGLIDEADMKLINKGEGSYHTSVFLKNEFNPLFINLSYLLPFLVKAPWFINKGYFKKFCGAKTSFLHKTIGILALPFHNPALFREKLLNYIRMLWVYLCYQ